GLGGPDCARDFALEPPPPLGAGADFRPGILFPQPAAGGRADHDHLHADHLAYISLLGVIGLAVAAAERARIWGAGLLLAAALVLAAGSRSYAAVFHDEDTLWTYTLRGNPEAWSAHYNLATWLARRGQLARAEGEFQATLRLRPAFAEARFNY